MGSEEATVRSPAALLASEMVSALQQLTYESRLEALALATAETLLDPNHGGDATSRIEDYTERLAGTVRKGAERLMVAAAPLRPSLRAPLVDHLRHWLAHELPGGFRAVIMDNGVFGTILVLSWRVEGRSPLYASEFFASRMGALETLETLSREVLEPSGFPPIPCSKLGLRQPRTRSRNAEDRSSPPGA